MPAGDAGSGTRRRGTLVLQVAAVCATAATAWFYIDHLLVFPVWHHTFDLRVYRGAVQWWLDGRPLYDFVRPHTTKGFTYPPFAVLTLLPSALGTETTATVLLTAASAAALVLTTTWLVAPVARRRGWPVWFSVALALPLAVAMEPVRETLGWGQVNLLLFALVLADVRALERARPWAGVGIGLAAAIKVTPALLVVYLALARKWRAAATATGTFLAATLLALVLDPAASAQFWTRALWDTDRVDNPVRTSNQSVLGLLARLAAPAAPDRLLWGVLLLVVVAVGLTRAAAAGRRGDQLAGVTIAGLTSCLVSPISWTHHLSWVLPAAVILLDVATGTPPAPQWLWGRARPRTTALAAGTAAAIVVAAFVLSVIWFFPGATASGRDGIAGVVGENAYLLIMVALVLLLPARQLTSSAAPSATRTTAPPRPAGSSRR